MIQNVGDDVTKRNQSFMSFDEADAYMEKNDRMVNGKTSIYDLHTTKNADGSGEISFICANSTRRSTEITVYDENGKEVTKDIIEAMYEGKDMGIPANIHDIPFFKEQLLQMNMIPCGYHRYYYREEEMLAHGLEEYNDPKVGTRGQQVQQTEHELFELYKNPDLDHKPEQLAKRGGAHYSDAACETIASIYGNKLSHIVVTTKNNGSVPDLPADCAVEVSSYIGSTGARAIAFGSLQPAQRGWLQCMKNMELCVEEAAVTGDYGLLMQAFILNPQTVAGQKMVNVLNELLIAHEKYLPQFADKIAELKASGVTIKDDVARELTEKGL